MDIEFISRLPNRFVFGFMAVELKEVKELMLASIRYNMKLIDLALSEKLEGIISQSIKFEQVINESLNETPTSVEKYIELMKYIQSAKLQKMVERISENAQFSTKIVEFQTQFRISMDNENVFYKYLSQLPLLHRIHKQRKHTLELLANSKDQFRRLIQETTQGLNRKFKKLSEEIAEFTKEAQLEHANSNLILAKNIEE